MKNIANPIGSSRAWLLFAAVYIILIINGAAFAQQPLSGPVTPTGSTPLATGWKPVTVVEGLARPWGLAFLPNSNDILITERPGNLRVVRDGELDPRPVQGMPEVFAIGQGGLLDIALHPDFENNRTLYLTHVQGDHRRNHTVLTKAKINNDLTRLTNVETIYKVPDLKPGGQHFGSRLLFLPDGSLLMSVGDGGNPPVAINGTLTRHMVQDKNTAFGKILRMNENGKPLSDNPFTQDGPNAAYVYALGLRNVQGMTLQPQTNDIYATTHGARGGDELNKIVQGGNYGWPKATYSYEYRGPRISNHTALPGMINPLIVWTPCIAPSGLAFYTGDKIPQWKGDLFAGGLVLRQIRWIDFENGKPTGKQLTLDFRERIRDVRNGPDGYLYVLTDDQNGKLLRLEAD